jgi:hypothetical protein
MGRTKKNKNKGEEAKKAEDSDDLMWLDVPNEEIKQEKTENKESKANDKKEEKKAVE